MSSYSSWRIGRLSWLGVLGAAALAPAMLAAADRSGSAATPGAADAATVEMFNGIRDGDIAVRFIPKDSREAKLMIENKTGKPLNVKLPDAFAGVPVLAQQGAAQQGQQRQGGQAQGGGGGMGMAYIPPEATKQLKVATVCLDHGKAEPRSAMPYQIVPIESVTDKPAVKELCRMLGTGQIGQRVAQAAAWHLNNGLSWEQLAAKRLRYANGTSQPYFSPQELQAAMQVAAVAIQSAQQHEKAGSSTSYPAPLSK